MNSKAILTAAFVASIFSTEVLAQLVIYPAKGQSAAQQQKDEGECYTWAKGQTGYDPAQASQAAPPPQQPVGGERVRGAARGALGGAAIGAIAGDTGKGAAIGAVAGTMAGGARQRNKESANQQAAAQQQQSTAAQQEGFQKAYAACFEGRGYTVK